MKSPSPRRQDKRLDARGFGALGQRRDRRVARGVGVARDVEPTKLGGNSRAARWLAESAAAIGMAGRRTAQRQHRLDAFAGREDVVDRAKPDGMAEQIAHGPSRRVDRRLAKPSGASQVRCAPVMAPERSVTAAIIAGQVSSAHLVRAIVAARMKPQRARIVDGLMPRCEGRARPSVPASGCDMANRPSRRFRRSRAARRRALRCRRRFGVGQTQKAARLIGDVAEVDETAALADHIEQIAMFGRGGIGPAPGGAGTESGPLSRTNIDRPGVLRTSPTNQ